MKKFFIVVIILSLVIVGCAKKKTDLPFATTQEVDTSGNFQFACHYEKEEPKFEFISPSGIIYKEGSENLNVKRADQIGFKSIYYLFEKGEKGEWVINYDKLSNETIDFFYKAD